MAVYVLDGNQRPLMPCGEKRARLLLERGRARVHRVRPFVIRLVDRTVDESELQALTIEVDPGSKATGIALVRVDEVDRYGFPRGYLPRTKDVRGFRTGDLVVAVVPTGRKAGTWTGRVAVRSTGSFNVQTKEATIQGISHRHCRRVQRADGRRTATRPPASRVRRATTFPPPPRPEGRGLQWSLQMTLMLSLDRPTRKANDAHRTRLVTFDTMSDVGRAAAAYLGRQLSRGLARDGAARDIEENLTMLAEARSDDVERIAIRPGPPYLAGISGCVANPMGPFGRSEAAALKAMVFAVTARSSGFATETVARVEDWRALHHLLGVAAMQHCGIVAWRPEAKPSRRRLGPDRVPVASGQTGTPATGA